MPLANDDVADQLSGSTFFGIPSVVGGIYWGSASGGSVPPAYIQTVQVDPSGSVFITSSGSIPVAAGPNDPVWVAISGSFPVTVSPETSNATTETTITASLSSQLLAAANPSRVGISVFNDVNTAGYLFLKLGSAASTSSYTTMLWPGSYWESPFNYLGSIYGIFTTATGSCLITEYT